MKLDDVPKVEWSYVPADDNYNDRYSHGNWLVYGSTDGNGVVSMYCAKLAEGSPHYWRTALQAKRYVEIKIHCAAIERALIVELSGGK